MHGAFDRNLARLDTHLGHHLVYMVVDGANQAVLMASHVIYWLLRAPVEHAKNFCPKSTTWGLET